MPFVDTAAGRLCFLHCPKTGGTSVEEYLKARFGEVRNLDRGWEHRWLAGGWKDDPLGNSLQHMTWTQTTLDPEPAGIFAIVRDPLARLQSEYRFQYAKRRRRWFLRLLTRAGFSLWWEVSQRALCRDPQYMDNQLRPQTDFLPPLGSAESGNLALFRLEDEFDALVTWCDTLSFETRSDAPLPHAQKPRGRRPAPIHTPKAADVRALKRLYRTDYDRLGYVVPQVPRRDRDWFAPLRAAYGMLLAPLAVFLWRRGKL